MDKNININEKFNEKCCICGTVKNCSEYLDRVFENIKKITEIFADYIIIIYYDDSYDDTFEKLNNYKKIFKLYIYHNKKYKSKYRTHRIAFGRNYCIKFIRKYFSNNKYFIMMDFDDVCSGNMDISVLKNALNRYNEWDALSFNKSKYYDLWALSIRPYIFSYIHFENPYTVLNNMALYITKKLNNLEKKSFLKCYSAFNGFAIYKTEIFKDCVYDGSVRLDLIPKKYLNETIQTNNSNIIFKNYNWIFSKYEDCEHRSFHFDAIIKKKARIFISPEILIN